MLSGSMFGVLAALSPATASASGTTWNWHQGNVEPPTAEYVWNSVSCVPSSDYCMAVGYGVMGYNVGAGVASTTINGGLTWSYPVIASQTGLLYGVSCPTTSYCMAVGGGLVGGAEAFLWNGTKWASWTLPSDIIKLTGVSCASTSFCEAVGYSGFIGVALKWSSSTWASQTIPSSVTALYGVSCVSAAFCEAVGSGSSNYGVALKWDGSTWASQGIPTGIPVLNSVSCASAYSCEAVGGSYSSGVALRWNSSTWTSQTVPSSTIQLVDVSCVSATYCMAIANTNGSNYVGMVLLLSGTSWTNQTIPSNVVMSSVSCASMTLCIVANSAPNLSNIVAAHTADGGTSWAVGTIYQPVYSWDSVSCLPSGTCSAAGDATYGFDVLGVVATSPNGETWSVQNISGTQAIGTVTCSSTSDCVALGLDDAGDLIGIYTTNGWSSWGTSAPLLSSSTTFYNPAVTCASSLDCIAVGELVTSGNEYTGFVSSTTNGGQSWSTPQDISGTEYLYGVACPSPSECVAVGSSYEGTGGVAITASIVANTITWSQPSAVSGVSGLNSVSCPSSTMCVAVGYEDGNLGDSMAVSGSIDTASGVIAWSPPVVIEPGNGGQAGFGSISCATTTTCMAVALNFSSSNEVVFASTTNGGASWPTTGTIAGSGGQGFVSCSTASFCAVASLSGLNYGTTSTPTTSVVCPPGTYLGVVTGESNASASPDGVYFGGIMGLVAMFGCVSSFSSPIEPLAGVPVTWHMPSSSESGLFSTSGTSLSSPTTSSSAVSVTQGASSPAIAMSSYVWASQTDASPGSFTVSATYQYNGSSYPLRYIENVNNSNSSYYCILAALPFGQSAHLSTLFGAGIMGTDQCQLSSSFVPGPSPTIGYIPGASGASGSFASEQVPVPPSGPTPAEWAVTANNSPGTWTAVISAAGVGSVSGPMTNTGTPVSTCPTSTYILRPHMNVTPNKYPLSPASFSGTVVEENMAGNQVAYGTDLQGNVMVSVNISTASGLEQIGSVQANPNQSWSLPVPSGLPPSPPGGWQVSATASACGATSGFSHTQSVSVKPFPTAVYVVPNNNVTGGDTLADPQTVQLRVAQSRCGCVPISYEGTPIAGNLLQNVATLMKTTYGGSPWTESGTRTLGNIAIGMVSNSGVTALNTQAGSSFHLGVTKGGRPAWSQQGTMHPIPNRQQSCQINQQLNTNCTTSMSPSIGPAGTVVTILGYHLSQGNYTNVQFDGINASTYSVFTSPDGMDTIIATVPKLPLGLLRSTRSTSGYIMIPVDISYGAKDTTTTSVGEFQYEYGNMSSILPVSNPVDNTPAPIQAACAPEAQVLQLASTPNSIAQGSVAVGICYTPNTNVNWFDPVQAATFAASGTSSVLEVPTATALSASTNPTATNQSETITATVTDAQNGNSISTGTVSFTTSSGATLCAEVPISSSGTATCTISPANSSYTVTATYNPPTGSVFEASTNDINITVAPLTCPQNQTMVIASSGSGQIARIDQSWPSYSATSQFAHRLSITIDCVSPTGTTTPVSGVPINFDLSSSGPGGAFAEGSSNAGSQQTVDTNSSGTATSLYFFANNTLGTWNATANYGNTQSLVTYQEENSSSISGGVCGASTLNIETEVSGYAQIAANNHTFTYPLDVAAWCHSSSGTNSIPTSLSGKSVTFGPANGIAFGTSSSMTASLTSSVPANWQNAPSDALYAQSSQFSADLSSLSTPEVVTFLPVTFPAPAGTTDGPEYITAPIASTTTVSCPSSSIYSQNVTCTVSVSSTGSPTGTVTISYPSFGGTINNPTLPAQSDTQTVTLVNGQATFTMNNLQTGTDSITTSYSGNSQVAPSQGSTTVTVHRDEVTLSLAALPQTALQGQVVTLTASGTLVPYIESVGQVTFTQGSQTLCSVVPINVTSNGQFSATCKVNSSSLALGTDTVTANYTDPSTSQVPSIYSSATASTTVNTEPLTCPAGQVLAVTADGSGQTAPPDAQFPAVSPASLFPQPLSIQVGCVSVTTGNLVTPIAGLSVSFTLPSSGPSGGFVSLNTVSGTSFSGVTNDQGIIQTPQILANSTVGSWNATANVLGSNISFSMTNTSSVSVCLDGIQTVFFGAGQTTRNGQPFAQPLSVAIRCGTTVNSSGQVVYSDPSSFTNMLNGHSVSFGSSTPPGLVFGSSSGASTASVPLTSTASTSPLYTSSVYAISPTMYADTSSSDYITTLTLPISVPPPASSATQMPEYIQGLTPTSIVLVCTPEVATYGTQIICTITVTANGQPVTTGTVTLTGPSGVTITCSPLNAAGQSTCSVSGLPVGTNTLTATYGGDSSGNASSSTSISVVIQKVPVQLQACSNQTIYFGQQASCLIKVVTAKGVAVTAGDVQFTITVPSNPQGISIQNSTGQLVPITVTSSSANTWNVSFNVALNSNGEAIATINGLPVGVTSINVQYMGSSNYQAT